MPERFMEVAAAAAHLQVAMRTAVTAAEFQPC